MRYLGRDVGEYSALTPCRSIAIAASGNEDTSVEEVAW